MEPTIKQVTHVPVDTRKWRVPIYRYDRYETGWFFADYHLREDYEEIELYQYDAMKHRIGYGPKTKTLVIADGV